MKVISATFFILTLLFGGISARPTVREVKDAAEFQKLIKHHAENTGLPVIVDFFSESCGPCRMIAPVFKAIAQEYAGKAVFAKVNTGRNQQLASQYQVRSVPTFMFFLDGKKKSEFSGAGEQQLQSFTRDIVSEAKKANVRLSVESLKQFYAKHDSSKSDKDVADLHSKCAKMHKSKECVGGAANDLALKLKKKYGEKPTISKRFDGHEHKTENTNTKAEKPQVNIHLASYEELETEYLKRKRELGIPDEYVQCREAEDEEEEEDDDFAGLTPYYPRNITEKVVIIGAGPAGLSAAIYTARAGLKPVVIAPPFGGQLMGKGVEVDNFPGLIDQTGPTVVSLMQTQAMAFGTRFEEQLVAEVDLSKRPFSIRTDRSSLSTHSIIIATGANSRWLGTPGEEQFRGGGVSVCATCDGFLHRNKPVVVVGGGDTAMEDALVLARTSSHVTVIHRRDSFRANKVLADRVLEHERISVMWNSTVKEFLGDDDGDGSMRLTHVEVTTVGVNEPTLIDCSGAFIAIGHSPNTELFTPFLATEHGYVQTFNLSTTTSVEGVFAAGDVADPTYRQAITSAGSGAMAALDSERWLSSQGLGEEAEVDDDFVAELLQDFASTSEVEYVNVYDHASGAGRREEFLKDDSQAAAEDELLRWASDPNHVEL